MTLRLAVDAMLGRLAKWLRLLGYDTVFDPTLDDDALARLAIDEGRVVLTRDHELALRRGLRVVYVESEALIEQLAQLHRELGLTATEPFTRCAVCNAPLLEVPREQAEGAVPPRVWEEQSQFWRCPTCGRSYWRGGHWARMQNLIERWQHAWSSEEEP